MLLSGIAKTDFFNSKYGGSEFIFNIMLPLHQYALITEWFDSVGIYIDSEFFRKNVKEEPLFVSSTTDKYNGLKPLKIQFSSRIESVKMAIIQANEIYNSSVKAGM